MSAGRARSARLVQLAYAAAFAAAGATFVHHAAACGYVAL